MTARPDQPVGEPVPGWSPRPLPALAALEGHAVRLEPLGVQHAEDLFGAWHDTPDARDWTYMGYDRPADIAAMRAWIAAMTAADVFYVILSRATGEALGVAAYIRIDPANGVIEIAHIHFSPRLQRTRAGTEAIYLMIAHAFDGLGYRRCEWKCDSLNAASRAAAARYGFQFEGIFRQAMVYKGRNRDTAWYAMVDKDWPKLKAAFTRWLDEANFTADGAQVARLSDLTKTALVRR